MRQCKERIRMRLSLAGVCVLSATLLAGCGLWQATKNTTTGAARAVFVAKVKEMNLEIDARAELNPDGQGQSLPVVVRIYQLKDSKSFEKAGYTNLLKDDRTSLKADLLESSETTLTPGASVNLSLPMKEDAEFVGVAGFFLDPDGAEWQLSIPKSQWKKSDPVKIVVTGNRLELAQ